MKKLWLLYLPLFVMVMCLLGTATIDAVRFATKHDASVVCKGDVKCLSNLMADGSDPMPLCRDIKKCPVILPPAAKLPSDRLVASIQPVARKFDGTLHAGCWKSVAHQGPMWFDPCPR